MKLVDEKAEDEMTDNTFHRQCLVSLRVNDAAKALYGARAILVGGAMDWASLTPGQQAQYRAEIETLVKGK